MFNKTATQNNPLNQAIGNYKNNIQCLTRQPHRITPLLIKKQNNGNYKSIGLVYSSTFCCLCVNLISEKKNYISFKLIFLAKFLATHCLCVGCT